MAQDTKVLETWRTDNNVRRRRRGPPPGVCQLTGGTTNINAAATDNLVDSWSEDLIDTEFSSTPSRITCLRRGRIKLSVLLSFSGGVTRYNGRVKLRLNGTTDLPPRGKSGYVRSLSGHREASLDIPCWWVDAAKDDFFEVLVDRESASPDAMTLSNGESVFAAEHHGRKPA